MRIVLVVADSLRADHVGVVSPGARTPTLDRLAADGAVVENVVSASPWTLPSMASMLTGVYGHRVGLVHWKQPWRRRFPTLFHRFAGAGYATASHVFDPAYLFTGMPEAGVRGDSRDEDALFSDLTGSREQDEFVFIQYWGTHIPYIARPMSVATWKKITDGLIDVLNRDPVHRDKLKALYRLSVERFSEEWIPKLLAALDASGDMSETLIVVTSDHGETWGERQGPGRKIDGVFDLHGNSLHGESLRVPLIMVAPGRIPAGRRIGGLVSSVDVAPTILELAGLTPPLVAADPALDGVSLLKNLVEGGPSTRQTAVSARNRTLPELLANETTSIKAAEAWHQFSLTTPEHKWIWGPGEALVSYDLVRDPTETSPVTVSGDASGAALAHLVAEYQRSRLEGVPGSLIESLRELAAEARASVLRRSPL
ncbi:MAG: sulfatase [Pseudomonadota bacterium]